MSSKLKLQPPQKHVDKSQKQQFIVEFPPELTQSLGSVAYVNIDRKHFLPPVLLTGIAKQQKEEKGKTPVTNPVFQGELSIQVLSREDKEITFEKCERCQEKIDAPEEKEHQHPRNCFALIGCDKVQFEKGKAVIPVYFRCCPTHHTSKKGENFVRMRVRIVKSPNVVFESDFMQVQWKKGKHNRIQVKGASSSPSVVPQPCVNSISSIVNANANRESAFLPNPSNMHSNGVPSPSNSPTTSPPLKPTTHQLPPLSASPSATLAPVVPTPTKPTPSTNNHTTNNGNSNTLLQLPSLLNKEPNTTSTTTTTTTTSTTSTNTAPTASPFMLNPLQNNPISNIMNNTGVPPYQAYMNMFQHLQTYYVQPLEEENKKLRQELSDITRSLSGLKEENRKLNDTAFTFSATRDVNFLDQLKYYQYEIDCNPAFLSYDDDEEMLPEEEKEEFESNHIRSYGRRTMREAIKFMKFKSNVKLVLLKHNGTQWFEPLDRRNTSTYLDGERFGIRIINKNTFPVYVRLHKITSNSTSQNIPLSDDDFLRIEGCEQENKWEPTYFDLGTVNLPNNSELSTSEPVELMKLLVTTNGNKIGGEKLSVILTKSYVISKKTL